MNYKNLVERQTTFFNSNQTKAIGFRIEQLRKFKAVIQANETELYRAIYHDFKKSEFETYATELSIIYEEINANIKNLPKWSSWKRVWTNLPNLPGRSYIIPEPLGVCLIIGAWNYPYQMSLMPAVSAIAAGNTVIIKPSELSPATSRVMEKIVNAAFSAEYLSVIEGGIEETTNLLKEKLDKIFFTGSTTVGKIIYQAAAKNLTPVTLELGGKSPAIVTQKSNLKDSAKRLVWSKFLNAGQTCIAPDYILVDETRKEELLAYLKAQIIKFDYSFENGNYVQIINERNFNRLTNLIDKEKIYYGGEIKSEERYIGPTILTNVSFEDKVMQDEIFGPILPVISYRDLNDIIGIIKSRPKPLACYVFTDDDASREKILSEISFGGGCVNDALMHISNGNLPYGGVGFSGLGAYHHEAGFSTFSHHKSILDKPFWLEPSLKYSPYNLKKLSWIKWITGR